MAQPLVLWSPFALAHVTPSKFTPLKRAELPPRAVAWNGLKHWLASAAPAVTSGSDPALTAGVIDAWRGEHAPTTRDVGAVASAWRLLGQGGGERPFAFFLALAFDLAFVIDSFVAGPPVVIGFKDRHFGTPATPLTDEAWKALRIVWLAASEADRAAVLPRVREVLDGQRASAEVRHALELMLEESASAPLAAPTLAEATRRIGPLDFKAVRFVHENRFDLLARFEVAAGPLFIEALGVGREHGIGVEMQRDFVEVLSMIRSPQVSSHMEAELLLEGTRDFAISYFGTGHHGPGTQGVIDFREAHRDQRRWSRAAFQAEVLGDSDNLALAQRLVWATWEDGFILDTFRIGTDGALHVGSGDDYELPDDAPIGLVKREDLDAITLRQWQQVLADHELTQPFPQLAG